MAVPIKRWPAVRLFYGHAESVLWFPSPVPYNESGLTPGLLADLLTWDRACAAAFTGGGAPSAPEPGTSLEARRLGRRVAQELGWEFDVDVDGERLRSSGPGRPEAAAAFTALADRVRDEREWLDLYRDEHPDARLTWRG